MTACEIYFVVSCPLCECTALTLASTKENMITKLYHDLSVLVPFFPFSYRGFLKESITTQLKMVLLSMGWDLRDKQKINWGSKFT